MFGVETAMHALALDDKHDLPFERLALRNLAAAKLLTTSFGERQTTRAAEERIAMSSDANPGPSSSTTVVVLLVVNDFLVRQYLADELRERGCEVVEATSAEDAITLIQGGFTSDIVFADHELSGSMTGVDFVGWLQRNTDVKALLTAGSFHPTFSQTISVKEFVSKPFTAEELCKRIELALDLQLKQTAILYNLIYISNAELHVGEQETQDILEVSRQRNTQLGITGMLLFANRRFIQILEGSKAAVEKVFASIANDKRHTGVKVLSAGNIETRKFGAWSMGFEKADAARIDRLSDAFILDEVALKKLTSQTNDEAKSLFASFLAGAIA